MIALRRSGTVKAAALAGLVLLAMPVQAQPDDLIDDALRSAARTFERAAEQLDAFSMGVSKAEYGDALTRRRFASALWGATLHVRVA
ncbi:MAG: hypothetical protein ABI414_12325, partial [Devosia sp.]